VNSIFITVRSNSKRLPNKAYKKINNKHTIEYVILQAKKSKLADSVILCTTNLPEDDLLCKIATDNNIQYFRGSEIDKLERWNGACKKYGVNFFVTADGDDLFCSHELFDLAILQNNKNPTDFIYGDQLVCGSFTYGISSKALQKVCKIKNTDDTEMMWVYFTETGLFDTRPLYNVPQIYQRKDIRMTLDYEQDFLFFSTVIQSLNTNNFNTRDVLNFLDQNKNIIDINFYLEEQWKSNQLSKTKLIIKEVK
jgi:spore coat polysaccharide biosynthesis protein SpsF